ncbi:MAG TPA: AI-2E family transporter, partial [Candidatus Dormibacteraeota bacterium]|nr:AI-2E family transporter [Candidatus Dormibacteraeota bacterium]
FDQIAHVIGNIAHNIVKLLLAVLSLFFVYRDGERFTGQFAWALEQVLGPRVHNYLRASAQTVKAVVYGLVLAAVVVWLFLTGSTVAAIGLTIWCSIVMGWTDHITRPFLISQQARIPVLVVLFGVLGGLAAFGLVGLFVGPVILAVLLAIWREWLIESRSPGPPVP